MLSRSKPLTPRCAPQPSNHQSNLHTIVPQSESHSPVPLGTNIPAVSWQFLCSKFRSYTVNAHRRKLINKEIGRHQVAQCKEEHPVAPCMMHQGRPFVHIPCEASQVTGRSHHAKQRATLHERVRRPPSSSEAK